MPDQVNGDNTPNQDPTNQNNQTNSDSLGWRAALPDEYKNHDFVKTFTKPGDFVKSALEIKTERDGLKTKMDGAIFKPGEGAKQEEISAFYKSLGVPEKSADYEFPKGEGVEHDENMISWARDTFHKANLTKDQAGVISQAWDGFIQGMANAKDESNKKAVEESTKQLKAEWGADYDKNLEFTKRGWKKFTDTEFDKFCEETGTGNHPLLIKFIHKIGKAMGEDFSPAGSQQRSWATKEGLIYNKSPAPPSASR